MSSPRAKNAAETYEEYFVPAMFLPWTDILLRHAALRAKERVLDVACGTGIVARRAAPLVGEGGQVVGVDRNPAMLAVARATPGLASGASIHWQEGDALALPFADGAFDVVLCQHGLPFFPDRARAVGEMRRVSTRGGRAAVIVLQALERHPVFEALIESVARHLSLPLAAVTIPFSMSDAGALESLFTAAGFTKVDVFAESTLVRFSDANRFVPLAVTSSAAAVPAFAQLDAPERTLLLDEVRSDVEPTLSTYREADVIAFAMHAHVVTAVP